MAQAQLSEELLSRVVDAFYERVRADPELGPVFNSIIGGNWAPHIRKIMSFWLTATRVGAGYPGRDFMPAHLRHNTIRAEQIPKWLTLFRDTCRDLCEPEQAEALIRIAELMAENVAISLRRRDSTSAPPGKRPQTSNSAGPDH
ncbi:MAG: group III truncated hemoglobin [Beijerinckiaceae bacterium]